MVVTNLIRVRYIKSHHILPFIVKLMFHSSDISTLKNNINNILMHQAIFDFLTAMTKTTWSAGPFNVINRSGHNSEMTLVIFFYFSHSMQYETFINP